MKNDNARGGGYGQRNCLKIPFNADLVEKHLKIHSVLTVATHGVTVAALAWVS